MPRYGFGSLKGSKRHLFFKSKYNCKSLVIPLLTLDDVKYIISSTLDEEVPTFLCETVLEVSGGNAYWVKSISRFIKHTGIDHFTATLQQGDEGGGGVANMRKRLERHIVCHLEMFTAKVQTIAKYAALIGDEFNEELLRAILPDSVIDNESDLATSLHTLSEEGIIYLIATKPPVYAFHNEIIRTTLYDFVLPTEASFVHQKIGQTMEKMFKDNLSPYFATLSYHFAMSPSEMKPYAFFYTVQSADLELAGADFGMSYMYLQYALTFMEYQNELEVISKVVDGAIADMMQCPGSGGTGSSEATPVSEEVTKNFAKLKADLKAGIKSKKFNGVEMKQSGNEHMFEEDFLQSLKSHGDTASLRSKSTGMEGDDSSGTGDGQQDRSQEKSGTKKSSGGCVIS